MPLRKHLVLILVLLSTTVSAHNEVPTIKWDWPWDSSSSSSNSQFDHVKFELLALKKSQYNRTSDGSNNNLRNPSLNSVNTTFRRLCSASYQDGTQVPNSNLPNPRDVSNIVGSQPEGPITPNRNHLTALFTFWGQFIDHDLSLGLSQNSPDAQKSPIVIPAGDKFFTPGDNIPFSRTQFKSYHPRAQKNSLNGWLDGSPIYGDDPSLASSLRTRKNGKLKTSEDNLLSRDSKNQRFVAGDIRVNENLALTTIHTLLNRQHNRLCDQITRLDNTLTDDQIYSMAKNYLIGILQKIIFDDWLPHLLGSEAWSYYIGQYTGYDQSRDARIPNQFANAAFRIGHPLLIPEYPQINQSNQVVQVLKLKQMFERHDLMNNKRMNLMLRGLTAISSKQKSRSIIDDVRNFLFLGNKNNIKLDLFALNLQRSRDHGLPSYNAMRQDLGLESYSKISDITSDSQTVSRLTSAYGTVNNIEPWVGIICQNPNFDGVLGQLGSTIAGITFRDIRAGDRLWYENYMDQKLIRQIKRTTLGDIILRNTDIKNLYNENVFKLPRY